MEESNMDPTSFTNSTFNMTTNPPGGGESNSYQVNVFFAIFLPALIVVTTFMNLATIAAFWKLPTLREKPSELLILNLSCADLMTGMLLLPIVSPLYITPGHWPFGESGCIVTVVFLNSSIHGSLFALTTISVDRFLLVYMDYPQYIKKVTRARVYKILAAGWVCVVFTVVIELSLWEVAKKIDDTARSIPFDKVCLSPARRVRDFSLSFFSILYFCPVILVCGLSTAFLYQLRKRLQKTSATRRQATPKGIRQEKTSTGPQSVTSMTSETDFTSTTSIGDGPVATEISEGKTKSPQNKRDRKTVSNHDRVTRNRYIKPGITLVGLVVVMASCMLPFCFYVVITEWGCEKCNNTKVLYGLLLLQFCNACLDPFIYVMTRKKMRLFYSSRFRKLRCR